MRQTEANNNIRQVSPDDRSEWLRMRRALWEDSPEGQQVKEMEENLGSDVDEVFVAERPEGGLCGFLESATRSRANGCDTTPVGYIEGWYVDEDVRRQGVGRALIERAVAWASERRLPFIRAETQNNNVPACKLYESCGFRLGGFDRDLYRGLDDGTREVALFCYRPVGVVSQSESLSTLDD